MILSFHPCITADRQVILGSRDPGPEDLSLIARAKAIILPQSCKGDLYRACKNSSAVLFPDYDTRFAYPGKVGQSLLFRKQGLPHPNTLAWNSVADFRKAYRESSPHRMPFFLKANMSHEADGVYFVEDNRSLESALECLSKENGSVSSDFISQEFIPAEGNVLRAVILEEEIILYWKRPERPGQIITALGKGAKIDKLWRMDLQEKGRVQAQRLSTATGINLAAVDFLFPLTEDDPQPLFQEINYYFGRRGLGGSLNYYGMLFKAIKKWLLKKGIESTSVKLV